MKILIGAPLEYAAKMASKGKVHTLQSATELSQERLKRRVTWIWSVIEKISVRDQEAKRGQALTAPQQDVWVKR